ncbi:kinesin-like protein KIF17 [Chamaea fasciata]|uniref:kinesin-like protein KIF17 n=1 Tax=Chamaea fasciata TaxID=190680 RepID=UPI00336A7706
MATEAVKVAMRCWPLSGHEVAPGCRAIIGVDSTRGQCLLRNAAAPAEPPGSSPLMGHSVPPRQFSFDGAFGAEHSIEHIYEIACPLAEGVMEGYNGTIFAHGQTGSGKSFTMQGAANPSSQKGIIPRAFEHIFESVQISEGRTTLGLLNSTWWIWQEVRGSQGLVPQGNG